MDHEYYSSMYSWFEKCGIISNIRTHLRQNLISALKNKDIILKKDNTPKSAKQYIYDLLIAEYLFNHNYAYTLSVFASEAPLLINFHNNAPENVDRKEKHNKEKLQSDYVLHTLETLGINPKDVKGQYVISQYVNNDMPLLLCILKCIAKFSSNDRNISPVRERRSLCNAFTQTEFSWQSCNTDIERLLMLKKRICQQKEVISNKFREREMMLKEQALIMEQQLVSLNTKLQQIQSIMRSITIKEQQLKERKQTNEQNILQKEMKLALKEQSLLQETNRLQREQNRNRKFEQDLKKLQEELAKVQKDLPRKETYLAPTLKNTEVQTDNTSNTVKDDEINILIKDKEDLTNLVQEQQLKIEQITQRALQLSRQVEEIHTLRPTSVEIPMQTGNANTVISESSSTEDILQDAKLRLKRLEEESLKADQ